MAQADEAIVEQQYARQIRDEQRRARRSAEPGGGKLSYERPEESGYGAVPSIEKTPWVSPYGSEAERQKYAAPEAEGIQKPGVSPYEPPAEGDEEGARGGIVPSGREQQVAQAIAAQQAPAAPAIDEQERKRALQKARSQVIKEATAKRAQQAFAQARTALKTLEQAKQVRSVLAIVGVAAACTLIGIIWTLIQWNIQTIWTVFGLPGKEFIGLHWSLAFLTVLLDIIIGIIIIGILFIVYAAMHKGELLWEIAKEIGKKYFGNMFSPSPE